MITFKTIYMQNFQSVGNNGIELTLDDTATTLIGGSNGSGKSTMLESISYCLFGKPLKKVKLSGLINSINKKAMLTQCVFEKHGHEYRVVRGEKPKKFEIYKNDELIDQNAASKDYQATLEKLLGMDHKLFTQVVVLNRERYIPFMDMAAGDRRKVVEDILDINIFGYMNEIVKKTISSLDASASDDQYERDLLVTKRDGVVKLIDQAKDNIEEQVTQIQGQIDENQTKIKTLESDKESLSEKIEGMEEVNKENDRLIKENDQLSQYKSKFADKLTNIKKEKDFYTENDTCPTCEQSIDDEFKEKTVAALDEKKNDIKESLKKLVDRYKVINENLHKVREGLEVINGTKDQIRKLDNEIDFLKRECSQCQKQIDELKKKTVDDSLVGQKKELDEKIETFEQSLKHTLDEREQYLIMKNMLKDDGIKSTIVDDYVGFINKKMNEYLNQMGFFLNITLDGNFNDTVNSINRSGFTYDNLSTGQKTRLNIAILLVLLEISTMKNSVECNILCMDELLENIDQDGVGLFMALVREKMKHKNFICVTQRFDEFKDYFDREVLFEQGEDEFTRVDI